VVRDLIFRLTQPGYTIYHRAALGGLAATVRAWGVSPPEGIAATLEPDRVRLQWNDGLADQEAIRRILDASFRLTKNEKLIDLVGHAIPAGAVDLRLAIHNGLCATFLQHHRMRPSEKAPRQIEIRDADGQVSEFFTYKAVNSYAHQSAQGTGLLAVAKARGGMGALPQIATIPQSVIPGAMKGQKDLEATAEEAVLLLFLMVGCSVFLLRPWNRTAKFQACVVVPDVTDLVKFAGAIQSLATAKISGFSNTYLGRVVGGAEEAALRLLIDLTSEQIGGHPGLAGVQVVAMGKVAWDKNQIARSGSVRVGREYPELRVFGAARTHLGGTKILRGIKGDGFAIPASPVPELVAANLVSRRHWAAQFCALVATKKDFANMRFAQKGLSQMQEVIQDKDDIATIELFQGAWRQTMGALGERARREGLDFGRLVEVERERIRNGILRSKTSDALAGWLLRFCADATKGAPLEAAQRQHARLRSFLFDRRNSERIQNLLLFALVSYVGETKAQTIGRE
jgi:CRISPR-associated protein Cas8a1/Csx13